MIYWAIGRLPLGWGVFRFQTAPITTPEEYPIKWLIAFGSTIVVIVVLWQMNGHNPASNNEKVFAFAIARADAGDLTNPLQ